MGKKGDLDAMSVQRVWISIFFFWFACFFCSFVYRLPSKHIAWFIWLVCFLDYSKMFLFVNNVNSEVGDLKKMFTSF
jgi:hypothetical protein